MDMDAASFNNSNRRNGSIILKNVNDPDRKNSTGNVMERIKFFTGGADNDESASSVFALVNYNFSSILWMDKV